MNVVFIKYRALLLSVLIFIVQISVFNNSAVAELQVKRVVLSGHVKDAASGEILIGATVFIPSLGQGTVTNSYGYYSLSVPQGSYSVKFGFLGFSDQVLEVNLTQNRVENMLLFPSSEIIGEVVVEGKGKEEALRSPGLGMQQIQGKTIKKVPVLMGETDLVKVIQLMPGVMPASEGSSGFSVRGGNPDQNLILLDEAAVYNAGHLMGFFSVFNNDAVKDVKLYKGDVPAMYGGRLSSLLDVKMKDGNHKKITGTGGVGTIATRLTLEGPIGGERTSFIVSGRRTYADLFLKLSSDEDLRNSALYFYDLNAKLSHTIDDNNRIFVSGYKGSDVMKQERNVINYGNNTITLRWNHIFSPRLFSNIMLLASKYDYYLESNHDDANRVSWRSSLNDYGVKSDFTWYITPDNTLDFGGQLIYHKINPGLVKGMGADALIDRLEMPLSHSAEYGVYVSDNMAVGSRFNVRYGLRMSIFSNLGGAEQYYYDDEFEYSHSRKFKRMSSYNTKIYLEPRISWSYVFSPSSSLKGGYARTAQYIHQATNSTSGSPLDVWFVSSPNVKPQISDQFSVGVFHNIRNNKLELSLELFYKKMYNSIDFKDHAKLLLNEYLEGELRFGSTTAFGAEAMVKLDVGPINGWVSYTLSKAERRFKDINDGITYRSPYDHPHDINVVLNGKVNERSSLSANWVFYSGNPTTFPVGRYEVGGNIVPLYSNRNTDRMPDYHRLDLSYTLEGRNRKSRRWSGEWVFSIYNAYGRKNAWSINFEVDEDDPYRIKAQKVYLFSIIPSVSYNFKF